MNRALKSLGLWIVIQFQRWIDSIARIFLGIPNPKWSIILPDLYLGGQYKLKGVPVLISWGITAVVNMRTTSIHLSEDTISFKLLNLPTKDNTAPTQQQLQHGVTFIENEIRTGGKVYIHCRQGFGRGPTMVLAYLISQGMTLDHAVQLVKQVRSFIKPTKSQIEALMVFEENLAT